MLNKLLDASIFFSFDLSGFLRHCPEPIAIEDLKTLKSQTGLITGASSGIGLALAKEIAIYSKQLFLISRKPETSIKEIENEFKVNNCVGLSADMAEPQQVQTALQAMGQVSLDFVVLNAGAMPLVRTLNSLGQEQIFASQVIGHYKLLKYLIDNKLLRSSAKIIWVSSGGMYTHKLDMSDIHFKDRDYDKLKAYANAKRAQVVLNEILAEKYPEYQFAAMHPGWVATPGLSYSISGFAEFMESRLRSPKQGADTIVYLLTRAKIESGKFWFDRAIRKTVFFKSTLESVVDRVKLLEVCEQ